MKIGLDYHGVIKSYPNLFRMITNGFNINDIEVHIITGCRKKDVEQFLQDHDIYYTHFYSITDEFLKHKIPYKIDENGNYFFREELWNTAKSLYCASHNIDIMIDDSEVYGQYFVTPYILFKEIKSASTIKSIRKGIEDIKKGKITKVKNLNKFLEFL